MERKHARYEEVREELRASLDDEPTREQIFDRLLELDRRG
jgi:hypothetical protein